MASVDLAGGLRIEFPDAYELVTASTRRPRQARGTRRAPEAPDRRGEGGRGSGWRTTPDDISAPLLEAFGAQQLELAHPPIDLAPVAGRPTTSAARSRARQAVGQRAVRIAVDVGPNESAVVLLETDGVFSWQVPEATDVVAPTRGVGRRGPGLLAAGEARRTVRFEFEVLREEAAPGRRPAARGRREARGLLGTVLGGRVRAYVLKFAARAVIGPAVRLLERGKRTGLVLMSSADPAGWRYIDDLASVALPDDRPARLLLFLHGTFSNTLGSFGALGATAAGRAFLDAAVGRYDAVVGYDHRTLSRDPLQNAEDLLDRLARGRTGDVPPTIDIVSYSRGGLVARSLVEYVLPSSGWHAAVDRVVFVAVPHHGTHLADPDNWRHFVDLYTNLAAAAGRAVSVVAPGALAGQIVAGLVESVGAFVKYLVAGAVDGRGVPGLAAMDPDGPFIEQLNETQPGQPAAGTPWYVISSDFEPSAATTPDLPRRLVSLLTDRLVDQLFGHGQQNDLVVDTTSMSAIETARGGFVKDAFPFGTNGLVYHLRYFVQPEVPDALCEWLGLRCGQGTPPPPERLLPGLVVAPDLPRAVRTHISVVGGGAAVSEVRAILRRNRPEFVVVERPVGAGLLRYALAREELTSRIAGVPAGIRIERALGLRERDAHPTVERVEVAVGHAPADGGGSRHVVLDAAATVGVLGEPHPPMSLEEIAGTATTRTGRSRRAAGTPAAEYLVPARRRSTERAAQPAGTGRSRARPNTRAAAPPAAPEPATATAHVSADMPAQGTVATTMTVRCQVSRAAIEATAGHTVDAGVTPVATDRPVTLQVVAKKDVDVIGIDRVDVPLPPAGDVGEVYFDVQPTHSGTCEVWVVVRQGPVPLLTLRLTATVTTRAAAGSGNQRSTAAADVPARVVDADDIQWLTIIERERGSETIYDYEIRAANLKLLKRFESPPLRDRAAYVASIYREIEDRWVSTGEDAANFEQELRAFGGDLFDRLIPPELQALLWKRRRDLSQLLVLSTEPVVPWELLHLKQPGRPLPRETLFLSQLGVVRWLYGTFPPTELRARNGRVRVVRPAYANPEYDLPETVAEEKWLVDHLHAKRLPATEMAVRALIAKPGLDVLHFAGHGQAEGEEIENAKILLTGRPEGDGYVPEYITARTVEQHARLAAPDGSGPLVVLNACQAGRLGHQLSSLGGFAKAFVGGGAAAFVSSLWSVGDVPARGFVEAFYGALLDGDTVAAATVKARAAARAAGDATWLAYVVYADPRATLSTLEGDRRTTGRRRSAHPRRDPH